MVQTINKGKVRWIRQKITVHLEDMTVKISDPYMQVIMTE
jgi:hypothetical protein